tara:strand:+ start:92 stop:322 length:231 start_codon:yes stop_codon:yes gene_type:complete
MDDPIQVLVQTIIHGYAVIIAFMAGWALPRGNALRMLQLGILKKIHNFLAYEDEIVVQKMEKTKRKIVRNKKYMSE